MATRSIDPRPTNAPLRPVAPTLHTAVLIAIVAAMTLAGAAFQGGGSSAGAAAPTSRVPLYLSLIAAEWALVLYLRRGLRRSGTSLRELIGGRWTSAWDVARDVALGASVWAVWTLVPIAWDHLFGAGHARCIDSFLPSGAVEYALWVLLSISAGFCEELVYRGYLLRQFHAWTRRPWLAVLLQAVLFGISHGYQGVVSCAKITLFGLAFGFLALWRRSLRPGMMAHALTDILAVIVRI